MDRHLGGHAAECIAFAEAVNAGGPSPVPPEDSLAVIAVLDGHVLGGGLELAAVGDLRIAERQIKIGQPETGLGIIPGWSGTQRAVRRFGPGVVRRMALFGEVLTAEQALACGIVDQMDQRPRDGRTRT